jgi:hypothetical protein
LIGLLPPPYLQRLQFRFTAEQFQEPLFFESDDPDHQKFLQYALLVKSSALNQELRDDQD